MRVTRTYLLAVSGLLFVALSASAVNRSVKPADYSAIEKRNPFGLVDPPKPEPIVIPVEPVEKEPPPNVELTGMFHDSIRNKTYALFLLQIKGETKKRSYMLSEGEGQGGLKVEEIDRNSNNVKINLEGLQSTITFNKPKVSAVTAKGVPPAPNSRTLKRQTGRSRPNRNLSATALQTREFNTTGRKGTFSGSRGSRTAVAGGMSMPSASTAQQPVRSNNSLRAIPTREMRTVNFTPQEQAVLIEAQRAKIDYQRQVNPGGQPAMPPLPPTALSTPDTLRRITVPSVPQRE